MSVCMYMTPAGSVSWRILIHRYSGAPNVINHINPKSRDPSLTGGRREGADPQIREISSIREEGLNPMLLVESHMERTRRMQAASGADQPQLRASKSQGFQSHGPQELNWVGKRTGPNTGTALLTP